jgi:hypothetical protein
MDMARQRPLLQCHFPAEDMPGARPARRVQAADRLEGGDHSKAGALAAAADKPNSLRVQLHRNTRRVGRTERVDCGKPEFVMKPLAGLLHRIIDRAGSYHDAERVLAMPRATDTAFGIGDRLVEPNDRIMPAPP